MWFNEPMRRQVVFAFLLTALFGALAACGPVTPFSHPTTVPTATPGATATAFPTAAPPSPTPTRTPDPVEAALDEVQSQVLTVRGMTSAPAIPRRRLSPEAMEARLQTWADTVLCPLPPAAVWQAFGLWPADGGDLPAPALVWDAETPAFFDPATATLYYTAPNGVNAALKIAYAHAYAHALRFYTKTLPPAGPDIDRCLAQQALTEGEATYTEYLWYYTFAYTEALTENDFQPYEEEADATPLPLAVIKYRDFPHDAGFIFIYTLAQENGWQSIAEAFEHPPTSTAEILHPNHAPAAEPPQKVDLPENDALVPLLGEGWRATSRGEVGEFLLQLMLTASTEAEARLWADDAAVATEGWNGGAWVAFQQPETGEVALLADVRWESSNDAVEFVRAFVRYIRGRYGPLADRAYQVLIWENPHGAAVMRYNSGEHRTTWAFAPTREQADALLKAIRAPGEY